MDTPIGIFDSGVGGLTVLSELKKLLPNESFIYVADQAFVPYGTKTQQELTERVSNLIHFLIEKEAKLIIIACNTATVQTVDTIREKFSVPIIGIVPVVKTVAEKTKTKKIAIFATPGTAKSAYLKELINKFAKNVSVEIVGQSGLEHLIEKGIITGPKIDKILKEHLPNLIQSGVDAIALGCTHYPFVKPRIQKIVGENVLVEDSGGAVARHAKRILANNKALSAKRDQDWYYTTGDAKRFAIVTKKLLHKKLTNIQHIDI